MPAPADRVITSRQNPLVQETAALARDPAARREAGLALLEGAHLIDEALKSGRALRRLFVTTEAAARPEVADRLPAWRAAAAESLALAPRCYERFSTLRSPVGVAATVALAPVAAAELLTPSARLVALAGVQDPGNAGAVLRTAEAAGASGALFCGKTADPTHPALLRASMGSALRLPCATLSVEALPGRCAGAGVRLLAAAPGAAAVDFRTADYAPPVALAVGAEGRGVPEEVLAAASARLVIPMAGAVESLNAGVAAALLLYRAREAWVEEAPLRPPGPRRR
jgi:TrmH family RNA methyltransferase